MNIRKFIRKALLEAFEFHNDTNSYIPPTPVKNTAQTAYGVLNKRTSPPVNEASNEGNGVEVVNDLITQKPISHPQLTRFVAFFENNKSNIEKERNLGKDATNSDLILIWQLHGGDECMNWSNHELDKTKQSNLKTKENMRFLGTGAKEKEGMGSMTIKTLMDPLNTRTHGQT